MLIIEGTDLVGKTTLSQTILEHEWFRGHGYIYAHLSRLPCGFGFWRYLERASRFIVQDRFHMSEPVYATMRNDTTCITPEEYRVIDGYLRTLGAYTIIITAPDAIIKQRYAERAGVEMYGLDRILTVNALFDDIVEGRGVGGFSSLDWNAHIHLNDNGSIPQSHIARVLNEYTLRQTNINALASQALSSICAQTMRTRTIC